jgi:DUF4097 and DUF4098 domain-containing protein YvlB
MSNRADPQPEHLVPPRRFHLTVLAFAAVLVALPLAACRAAPADRTTSAGADGVAVQDESQGTRYTLAGHAAVYNIVGAVRVEAGGGSAVVVEVTRRGADAASLRVETGERRNRNTLRVVYPGDDIVYAPLGRNSETQMWVREDGTFGDGEGNGRRDDRRSGRRIDITGDGEGTEASADLLIRVPAGGQLDVHLGVGKLTVSNVDGRLMLDVASADVETSGTRGALDLDLGSGNVSVTDAKGDIIVDTGSGDVTLSRIEAQRFSLDAGSGNLRATGVTAPSLELDTGSGDMTLTDVSSPSITLDSGSGSVEVELNTDVERLSVDAGSGSVTIRAPAALGARVEIETGSGDFDSDFELAITRRGDDSISGTIGDGRGMISVETGSGDVRLLKR